MGVQKYTEDCIYFDIIVIVIIVRNKQKCRMCASQLAEFNNEQKQKNKAGTARAYTHTHAREPYVD